MQQYQELGVQIVRGIPLHASGLQQPWTGFPLVAALEAVPEDNHSGSMLSFSQGEGKVYHLAKSWL